MPSFSAGVCTIANCRIGHPRFNCQGQRPCLDQAQGPWRRSADGGDALPRLPSFRYQPMELHDMRQAGDAWWPWPECPKIIVRFGHEPPGAETPRRPVADTVDRSAALGRPARQR
jgi:hypothetical protein